MILIPIIETETREMSVDNYVAEATTASQYFVLKNTPTEAEVNYLSNGGGWIDINGVRYKLAVKNSFNPATNTVRLATNATLSANAPVQSDDGGLCIKYKLNITGQQLYDAYKTELIYIQMPNDKVLLNKIVKYSDDYINANWFYTEDPNDYLTTNWMREGFNYR